MIDINFYRRIAPIVKRIKQGEKFDKQFLGDFFEENRSKFPTVYNIETTNACNMKCIMCPRTTMMTRAVKTMDRQTFYKIIGQITPWKQSDWTKWKTFVEEEYGIKETDMSENHFFLYIIPKVIQLHLYGDPLLDRNLPQYVKALSNKGVETYFSCNPANINIKRTVEMFESGLNYLKYSIESVDDDTHKKIRGQASNFSKSYKDICDLLEIKKEKGYKTTIVITMLDLNLKNQQEEYRKLRKAFEGKDVYIYLKSEDTQWYRQDYHETNSVHWTEICKHPWMSVTVNSSGNVVCCMEQYDDDVVLGNVKEDSLYNIWNGKKYAEFREQHLERKPERCRERCDMTLAGDCLND